MNDAWNPPESGDDWGGYDDGGPGSGGLPASRVFEPITLLKLGWAVLKEQPALVLLGGTCMFAMQFLPGLLAVPLDAVTAALVTSNGGENPLEGVWSIILSLFAAPFQLLFTAGLFTGTAKWVLREEQDVFALFTSIVPALRMLVAGIVMFFVVLPLLALLFAPIVGAVLIYESGGLLSSVLVGSLALVVFVALVWVQLGLSFVQVSAALDGVGPFDAVQASWRSASGARLVLLVTLLTVSTLMLLACCFAGLPLILVLGLYNAGFAAAWLLHSRPASQTASWGFVERNGFDELYRR